MPVFSRAALISLGVLVVTGVYQGWRESGATDALTTTTYGRLVLVKATLFLVLVSLGYASRGMVSRRLITAAAGNEGPSSNALISTPRLRQTVLLEAALGVVVLAVPAVLVARPPGRAAASASGNVGGHGPGARPGFEPVDHGHRGSGPQRGHHGHHGGDRSAASAAGVDRDPADQGHRAADRRLA